MIQPIGAISYNKFYSSKKQTSKPAFKAFYDPTRPHVTAQMRAAQPKDALDQIADKAKEAISKLKDTFFNNLPADAKDTLVQGSSSNSILQDMLAESTKSFNAKGGLEIVDGSNLFNSATGMHTHIMPDGTPISYSGDIASATPTDIAGDVADGHLQILDANNLFDPDNGILTHITPSGDALPIDLSDIFDDGNTATSFLSGMIDTISDLLNGLS